MMGIIVILSAIFYSLTTFATQKAPKKA